jgi:hypothetical protein
MSLEIEFYPMSLEFLMSLSNKSIPDILTHVGFLLGTTQPSNAQTTELLIISYAARKLR